MPRKRVTAEKTAEPKKEVVKNNENPVIKVVVLDGGAHLPTYATDGSGAFDIYSNEDRTVPFNGVTKIGTGLKMEIPQGYMMVIAPRSSTGTKTPLRMPNSIGIIDSDYRGEVMVLYENNKDAVGTRVISKGDRIAQGFLLPVIRTTFEKVDKLSDTNRAEGGFGSTGV